ELRLALAASPEHGEALARMAELAPSDPRFDREALLAHHRLTARDPLRLESLRVLGDTYARGGRIERARLPADLLTLLNAPPPRHRPGQRRRGGGEPRADEGSRAPARLPTPRRAGQGGGARGGPGALVPGPRRSAPRQAQGRRLRPAGAGRDRRVSRLEGIRR